MSETARPKPMPPKKPLVEADVNIISMDTAMTDAELAKFGSYFLNDQTPLEMHGEAVVIKKAVEKPKYVLKPHLTERALKGHEGLVALRKQLEAEQPKRGQRRNNKEKK